VHGGAGGEGDGGGGDGDGCDGVGGDGLGGGGDGEGGEGEGGGTGQAVWQTYLSVLVQEPSFHAPRGEFQLGIQLNSKQSSPPPRSSGWPGTQLVYDSGVLDGLHTHVPSDAASVPPIHT
jgi:hypothetical protein